MNAVNIIKAELNGNEVLLIIKMTDSKVDSACDRCIINSTSSGCNNISYLISIDGQSLSTRCGSKLGDGSYIAGILGSESSLNNYPTEEIIFNEFCKDSCIYYEESEDKICKSKKTSKCPLKWLF